MNWRDTPWSGHSTAQLWRRRRPVNDTLEPMVPEGARRMLAAPPEEEVRAFLGSGPV
jgi:hypothetical protein